MDRWQLKALKQRTDNNEAIAEAHVDAGVYGQGWLEVDEHGNLRAALVVDLAWQTDANGRPTKFTEVEGSEREIPCELVTLAMGFLHPQHDGLLDEAGISYDERGNVNAKEGEYQTSKTKYFAAGDMRRGQSLVVWAISEGRECARKVDEYLMGHSELESKDAIYSYA